MEAQKWIKVDTMAELQGGMTIKIVNCRICDRSHVTILARPESYHHHTGTVDEGPCSGVWWATTNKLHKLQGFCTERCLPEGRLFRLDVGDLTWTEDEIRDELTAGMIARAKHLLPAGR